MDIFYQTFGFVGAICAGIIILTVFFQGIAFFKRKTSGFEVVKLKGFIRDGRPVNVYLKGSDSILGVRLLGFTEQSVGKAGGIPYQLAHMVVLETAMGTRTFVRSDAIRMIEEVADAT